MFIYELSGCEFESCCAHLNFRYCVCPEQEVPSYVGNLRVKINSIYVCDMAKKTQSITQHRWVPYNMAQLNG